MFNPSRQMDALPFEKLVSILDNPAPVDSETMTCLKWWLRPSFVKDGLTILEAMTQAGIVNSFTDGKHLVKQGGVKLNGVKVSDPKEYIWFVDGSWLVIKVGKTHRMMRRKPC